MRSSHPCSRSLSRPRGIPPRARSILDIYLGTSELLSYYLAVHLIIYIYTRIVNRWLLKVSFTPCLLDDGDILDRAFPPTQQPAPIFTSIRLFFTPRYILSRVTSYWIERVSRVEIEWNETLYCSRGREGGKEGRKDDRRRFWTAWKLI